MNQNFNANIINKMNSSQESSAKNKGAPDQLPSITNNQPVVARKKSSLKSLQDIQSRRSQNNGSRQNVQLDTQQRPVGPQYPTLLNMSFDPLGDPRLRLADQQQQRQVKGKSYLEGNMAQMFHQRPIDSQSQDMGGGIGGGDQDERSQILHSGLRKRSPSDVLKRKSQPVTPRRLQQSQHSSLVPQFLDPLTERFNVTQNLRQSFKQQTLAPLDNALPELSQTHRQYNTGQNSNQQIGPFFSNQPSQMHIKPILSNEGTGGRNSKTFRSTSHMKTGNGNHSPIKSQPNHVWEKTKSSSFQIKNAPPKEVSEFLQQVIQEPISLMLSKPDDLDSTEALDSFLDTLYIMVEEGVCEYNETFAQKLHLATGVRTNICEDFLSYFAQLQTRNKLLINAVEFFNEYLTKISQLEGDKEQREKEVQSIEQERSALFLQKVDLERKLEAMSNVLKDAQESERKASASLKDLQKKYSAKIAECESLTFRIKNMEELSTLLDPPGTQNSIANIRIMPDSPPQANEPERVATIDSIGDNHQRHRKLNSTPGTNLLLNQGDPEKFRALESANKKLETELGLLKESLRKQQEASFNDNVDHFVRIQDLYNNSQIQNKQLLVTNKKMEGLLEAKERHITQLEKKIVDQLVQKEDIIVHLKSDIVLLKRQISDNEKNFEARLQQENQKFQKEFQSNFSSQEKKLKDEKDGLVREKTDLSTRINQLQNELEQMAVDFSKYRADITKKDQEKEQSISELQQKLKQSGQLNETQTKQLQDRIETFNNQNLVLQKQCDISSLKLKMIKETVEILYKQKMFIVENIERSKKNLIKESAQVEETMMNENGNKEYLISVKKAVKLSQTMLDMGLQAISQVANIVQFLKIDEVRNMIQAQDTESLKNTSQNNVVTKETQQMDIEKLNLLFQQEDIQDGQKGKETQKPPSISYGGEAISGLRIQKFIQTGNLQQDSHSGQKSADYYFNSCPIELSTILTKVLAEALLITGTISDHSSLPVEIQKLLSHGTKKSDSSVEQEIFDVYLSNTKRLLEEKIFQLAEEKRSIKIKPIGGASHKDTIQQQQDENKTSINAGRSGSGILKGSRLKNISKLSSVVDPSNQQQQQQQQNHLQEVSNNTQRLAQNEVESSLNMNKKDGIGLLLEESISKGGQRRISSIDSRYTSAKKSPMRQLLRNQDLNQLEQQIEQLKIKLKEEKLKTQDLAMQLAGKNILLEEKLEELNLQREKELSENEQLHQQELEKTKQAIHQREQQIQLRSSEFKERAELAEDQLKSMRQEVSFLNSEIERITKYQSDFDSKIQRKEAEIKSYKENVSCYVNLKVSQRNIFGLTLEISRQNESLINEAMLKYYFNKCFKIDKDKFRFLSTEEVILKLDEKQQVANDQVTVVKVLIEVVDDQENIDKYFAQLKSSVREGTSLLYDLQPLYVSINLGQCGLQLQDKSFMRDYHLIKRTGVTIRDDNYVVSVLRHQSNPLSFKVLAASTDLGEEFILDLNSRDLFELTEGKHTMLEVSEPEPLIKAIVENLTISVNQHNGVKTLQCEHKVFFNQMFINRYVPKQDPRAYGGSVLFKSQPSQDSLSFRQTSFRNDQILSQVLKTSNQVKDEFKSSLHSEAECQTETLLGSFSNLLNLAPFKSGNTSDDEVFVTTYQGYQRVGKSLELKIRVDEGQKSGTTILTFEEIRTKERCQVCMLDTHQQKDRYVIHSECIKFVDGEDEPHLMLITFEKFQEDGLLIKLHDLKAPASEEFFIVKKSNGQFSRLTRASGIETLIANGKEHEELRNIIFDLTFTLTVSSREILQANLSAMEQQLIQDHPEGTLLQVQDLFQIPQIKRAGAVAQDTSKSVKLDDIYMAGVARFQTDQFSLPSGVLLQKHERGELLYRNTFTIRCCFEGQDEKQHTSLISFYFKKDSFISVEVFLYRETQKMSIASQVSSLELFGSDYQSLTFLQKSEMLEQMMEKLYVLSENNQYHLKVENDAVPMSVLLQQQKLAQEEQQNQNDKKISSGMLPATRASSEMNKAYMDQIDQKLQEIEGERDKFLNEQKSTKVKSYAQINDRLFEYVGYFLLKVEKESNQFQVSPSRKNKQSVKKPIERQVSLSNNVEDIVDFEYVYIEATDKDEQKYSLLLSVKMISQILMSNPFEMQSNWQMIQSKDKEKLIDYLKGKTIIDEELKIMSINSYQPSKEYVVQLFQNEIGGTTIRKDDNVQRLEIEEELLEKRLLMNQEVDMSEFSYDVKLYQVFDKQKEKKALSYSFEMFSLNEPDLVYRFNYALHEQSSFIHSPIHIGFDIVNLIENPLSKVRQNEEAKRKLDFQELFQKYIDNRMILVVHEQIFPHQISFCLYETSSRLHWVYTFDPQQSDAHYHEFMSKVSLNSRWNIEIGQLSVIDSGTAERFIGLLMCDILDQSSTAQFVNVETREDSWADLGDTEALRYDLLKNRQIGDDLQISLSKVGVDCLKIELLNSKYQGAQTIEAAENSSSIQLVKKKSNNLVAGKAVIGSENQQSVNGNYLVKFVVNASQRNKFISKMIRVKDQDVNRLLLITCDLKGHEISVKVIELLSSTLNKFQPPRVLYQYIFKEKKVSAQMQSSFLIERRHLQEAIAEVCTCGPSGKTLSPQVIDKAGEFYEMLANKQAKPQQISIFTESISLSQRRLNAAAGLQSGIKGDKQRIILHRKSFYDEPHEKLIIVSVSIMCSLNRFKGHGPAQLCLQDIDEFKLHIHEPETQKKVDFDLKVGQCFLEDEILGGVDLKNINHLKKMARLIVEERAIIKRVGRDQQLQQQNDNPYTVEINLSHIGQLNLFNDSHQQQQQTLEQEPQLPKQPSQPRNQPSHSVKNLPINAEEDLSSNGQGMDEENPRNNVKITSGQTNMSVSKSQSFRMTAPDALPQQQSIIEEEGSQEENEDSPNPLNKRTTNNFAEEEDEEEDYERQKKAKRDRYAGSGGSDQGRHKVNIEDVEDEDVGADDEVVDEDQEASETSLLLFERELSNSPDASILQVLRSPPDEYALFQVRQVKLTDGSIQMRMLIDEETVEAIIDQAKLPEEAVDQQLPELFEAITDFIIRKKRGFHQ